MITRIVQMTFEPDNVDQFLEIFERSKEKIRSFEGCQYLELLQDETHENLFFTYSIWDSVENLEKYRNSELFQQTWTETKKLFAEKPDAWTCQRLHQSDETNP